MPPKLSSNVKQAIRRQRENQQFSLALEVLMNYDPCDKSALYQKMGYASDFIRVDALVVSGQNNNTENDINNAEQQNEDHDEDILVVQQSGSLRPENDADAGSGSTKRNNKNTTTSNNRSSTQTNLFAHSILARSSSTDEVEIKDLADKLWNNNSSNNQNKGGGGGSVLDVCVPPSNSLIAEDATKQPKRGSTSSGSSNASSDFEAFMASSLISSTSSGSGGPTRKSTSHNVSDSEDPSFRWFRSRSLKLEKMQTDSWKRYNKDANKTAEDVVRRVML